MGQDRSDDIAALLSFGWVLPPFLAASAQPGTAHGLEADLQWIRAQGITHIISATEYGLPGDVLQKFGFQYLHLPVDDMQAPTRQQMIEFAHYVKKLKADGHKGLVHCLGGVGRTGTLLASFLILTRGMTAQEAIRYVADNRLGLGKPGFYSPTRAQVWSLEAIAREQRGALR